VGQQNIVDQVRIAASQKVLFLPHAIRQMAHPERVITRSEVEGVIFGGTLIEDYPEDARGHSCLIGGHSTEGRFVHVVCSPKEGYLAVITAYLPDPQYWTTPLRRKS